MSSLHDRIAARLRNEVCTVCVMTLPDGSCGLPPAEMCPLFSHLDEAIAAVDQVDHGPQAGSSRIDPYVQRLREIVCADCVNSRAGKCSHREDLTCALDMYFGMVVEIIEDELAAAPSA